MIKPYYDVVVVGAGNAAICAALAAWELGASVLVLEKAPSYHRGGNTYFTGGAIRCAFSGLSDLKLLIPDMTNKEENSIEVEQYTEAQYYADLMRITDGLADPQLSQILASKSFNTLKWLQELGIRFIPLYGRQSFKVGNKHKFWGGLFVEAVGGGKGLSDQLFGLLEERGIDISYETKALRLMTDSWGEIKGVVCLSSMGKKEISANAVVLACGGFESNAEMRTRYLGPGWDLAKVRGVPYNTGDGIRMALEIGAQSYGHWSGCHAVAWDVSAPNYGDRKITDLYQKHSYPFGIIVNINGDRFVDEGADFRNYTYAKYGKEILFQPNRVAFQIFDNKVKHLLRDEYRIPQCTMIQGNTLEEVAEGFGIAAERLSKTVKQFNASIQDGVFDPTKLDGKRTLGLTPPKSNWALPIETPPYLAYAVTCGITFTFGGLRINEHGEVINTEGNAIPGLFAAGELVGGLFYYNYPGGAGLSAGSVFGKLAGSNAAQHIKSSHE